jgi:hypothetical protein
METLCEELVKGKKMKEKNIQNAWGYMRKGEPVT